MEKSYKFRLYPSKTQQTTFNSTLNACRYLYNTQIEYEKFIYEKDKRFACFSIQHDITPKPRCSNKCVGVDLGLISFATLSDCSIIENPRHFKKKLELLKRKSKQLSKKDKGSKNRSKSKFELTRLHEKILNQRLDFLHKLSHKLVSIYDCIALEDLNIEAMNNKQLQFSINDAAWGKFRQLLTYKAEEAGCKLEFVNPKDTSKECSRCGNVQDMPLSKRKYICSCGNSISRDLNAAINILNRSSFSMINTGGHSGINACGVERILSTLKQEITNLH